MSFARAAALLHPPTVEDIHPLMRQRTSDVLKVVVALHSSRTLVADQPMAERLGLSEDFVRDTIDAALEVSMFEVRRDGKGRLLRIRCRNPREAGCIFLTRSEMMVDGAVVRTAEGHAGKPVRGRRTATWIGKGVLMHIRLPNVSGRTSGARQPCSRKALPFRIRSK